MLHFKPYRDILLAAAGPLLRAIPVDVLKIASLLGVNEIEPRVMEIDGYLAATSAGRYVIRYREGASRRRVRFTIAHEIAHILIAQANGIVLTGEKTRGYQRFESEEVLANRLAAELLMPDHEFGERLSLLPINIASLQTIAGDFDVSGAAARCRLRELDSVTAVTIRIPLERVRGIQRMSGRVRVSVSGTGRFLFCRRPADEADAVISAWNGGHRFSVSLSDGELCEQIPMCIEEVRVGNVAQLHAYGWQTRRSGGVG